MTAHIEQLKAQLRQLNELIQNGTLQDEASLQTKARLERELVEAVLASTNADLAAKPALPAAAPAIAQAAVQSKVQEPPAQVSRKLIWGMLAFVVAVGAGGYAWVGNRHAWQVGPGATTAAADGATPAASGAAPHTMTSDQINGMVEGLVAKLKTDPNNAEGWAMLARTYGALGRFPESLPAYKRAIELRPDDAQLYADMADALGVTQGRKLEGEPAKLIAKAISLDLNNFKALFLSGTLAYDKQDFKGAADLWERALQHAPGDNPELRKQIKDALDDARQKAGLPPLPAASLAAVIEPTAPATMPAAEPAPAPAAAVSGQHISGTVSLSKAVQGKVSPEDTVFIFAKAAQGPKMPLAILRKQVKDLPYTYSLSDDMAMSPQMKLSGFSDVIVGARVSKSGQAMAQPGDWQGQSAPVKLGAENVKVEIADAVK
jgi:cytochrome c-type biogenesis protein CcmH